MQKFCAFTIPIIYGIGGIAIIFTGTGWQGVTIGFGYIIAAIILCLYAFLHYGMNMTRSPANSEESDSLLSPYA
jgi:hypothetical protein